ncbi:uncharacterized protein ARMOST_20913 [Armillaria ostoyae]|uniref:Uncharacterized protein n=1 Tax=Armillaria ostoyae TaxID=47428 RepID=A0A284S8N5_ARMOS|nr:uncharacterized protein ARMOST_20913 [Armillaria ostoyae]
MYKNPNLQTLGPKEVTGGEEQVCQYQRKAGSWSTRVPSHSIRTVVRIPEILSSARSHLFSVQDGDDLLVHTHERGLLAPYRRESFEKSRKMLILY